jgi:DNA polymerase sliding clamp subunit (PCNA homolog)
LQSTAFSISQQDVRTFLNGLLFELEGNLLRTIAADGHRMAVMVGQHTQDMPLQRFVLPRKSVYELLRLLNAIADDIIQVSLDTQVFTVCSAQYTFSSKLMDTPSFPIIKPSLSNLAP